MAVHHEVLSLGIGVLKFNLAPELIELLLNHFVNILFLVSDLAKQSQVCSFLMCLRAKETSLCAHLNATLDTDADRFLGFFGGIEQPGLRAAWQRVILLLLVMIILLIAALHFLNRVSSKILADLLSDRVL